jgi:LysM repeat protein
VLKKWAALLVLCCLILGVSAETGLAVLTKGDFVPCCQRQSLLTDSQVKLYQVAKGDTLWDIARRFNVDLKTITMINKLDDNSNLSIGQTLELPYRSSSIHVISRGETMWDIASRYDISVGQLQKMNPDKNPRRLKIGDKLTIPSSVRQDIAGEVKPSRGISFSGAVLAWPIIGVITSNYGWRKSGFHHGLDIAGDIGDSIKAADDGIVSFADYKSVYGRTVIIDHANKQQTLYAHLQNIYVKKGQEVRKGQKIATCGISGRTTGPHLHFEVREDSDTYDPLKYLRQ